jgi:hypothetical protein
VAPKIFPVGTMSIIGSPQVFGWTAANFVIRSPRRQEPRKGVDFGSGQGRRINCADGVSDFHLFAAYCCAAP